MLKKNKIQIGKSKLAVVALAAVSIVLLGIQMIAEAQSKKEYIYLNGKLVAVETSASAPIGCTYSINPTSRSLGSGSATGTVSVTAGSGCGWIASSNNGWITITSGSSGTGNGTVAYAVTANSGSARNGTMTIAGHTFNISQSSGCSYSINPTYNVFDYLGGTGSVSVTAGSGCGWTSSSNDSWITITGGSSGSGNGIVGYSVANNPSFPEPRFGTMTIAGETFDIAQSPAPFCGDTSCNGGETCSTCPIDCGPCGGCDPNCYAMCVGGGGDPYICALYCGCL